MKQVLYILVSTVQLFCGSSPSGLVYLFQNSVIRNENEQEQNYSVLKLIPTTCYYLYSNGISMLCIYIYMMLLSLSFLIGFASLCYSSFSVISYNKDE